MLLKKGNGPGTFLVRTIERVSAYYDLLMRDGDVVKHCFIRKDLSTTVDDLQHYARDSDGHQLSTQLITPCLMRTVDDKWEIECSSIELNFKLYDMYFGSIWEGTWNNTIPVVVKVLEPDSVPVFNFLSEAQIMKKLQHNNLTELYGVCTQEEPFYIVTELMEYGSLLDYMIKGKEKT